MTPQILELRSCPKRSTGDLDKARDPRETIAWVLERLDSAEQDILAECRRVDTGRLGIPVYMAVCGERARSLLPGRKQMGKGSSTHQARASALMELMERFSFFSFWRDLPGVVKTTWNGAKKRFGDHLLDIGEIVASVGDSITGEDAALLMDTLEWSFYPATWIGKNRVVWVPLEWFRLLGEFNGSAAGNTAAESLLQALCELVERHCSALYMEKRPTLPTIRVGAQADATLVSLIRAFEKNGVKLVLKDMTLGMPAPCVAALAWDPATWPRTSEIVFTAGCATSPAKAAIRAITEVAQLGGDFCTGSVYESSGLGKVADLESLAPLLEGPEISLADLPDISRPDIRDELLALAAALEPMPVFAVDMTCPELGIPAHWVIAPGLKFLERDKNQSVGLFVGRLLSECGDAEKAEKGFALLEKIYGQVHFLPFFRGLFLLSQGETASAIPFFEKAMPVQPDNSSAALAAFYAGYARTLQEQWREAVPVLEQAFALDPLMKEAANLLGVCQYKLANYAEGEKWFDMALGIDRGSAMDLANRGVCRKLQGKLDAAREDLAAALELDASLDFARKHLLELDRA